jgi:hypothetical protein
MPYNLLLNGTLMKFKSDDVIDCTTSLCVIFVRTQMQVEKYNKYRTLKLEKKTHIFYVKKKLCETHQLN